MGDATVNTTGKPAEKSNAPKTPKKSWFKGLKAEFSKIIWPDKETLFKESTTVVVISIVLGVVIALIDMIVKAGIDVII